jgi:hypothetical protein
VVRFLEGFADGQDVDMAERPPEVPLSNFVRYDPRWKAAAFGIAR